MTQDVKESGKVVLVVGGGDVAVDCARTARRLNAAEKVYSVCLEDSYDTMASSNHEIKGALAEGVKFNHAQLSREFIQTKMAGYLVLHLKNVYLCLTKTEGLLLHMMKRIQGN